MSHTVVGTLKRTIAIETTSGDLGDITPEELRASLIADVQSMTSDELLGLIGDFADADDIETSEDQDEEHDDDCGDGPCCAEAES